MSGAFVQTKFGGSASSLGPINLTLTGVGSGNHLMGVSTQAGTSSNPAAAVKTLTSTPSATWSTGIAPYEDSGAVIGQGIYYSENVVSGSWTVSFGTNSSSACQFGCIVNESSGVKTSSSLGAVNHHGNTSSTATILPGSITPTAASIVYTVVGESATSDTAGTISDSNYTFTVEEVGGGGVGSSWSGSTQGYPASGSAYTNNVSGSAANPTWTIPTPNFAAAGIVEFLAAATGYLPPIDPIYVHRRY